MIQQTLFEKGGADQIIPVFIKFHDGGFQLDPAARVQHVGQSDAAGFLRQPVGDQPVQHGFGVWAGNLHLCEGGYAHDAGGLTHRLDFGANHVVHHIATE